MRARSDVGVLIFGRGRSRRRSFERQRYIGVLSIFLPRGGGGGMEGAGLDVFGIFFA